MKNTVILIFVFIFLFTQGFGQQIKENTKDYQEEIPRYNFYHLSKYISNSNIPFEEKKQIYFALQELLGTEKFDQIKSKENTKVSNFIKNYESLKQAQLKNWFSTFIGKKEELIKNLETQGFLSPGNRNQDIESKAIIAIIDKIYKIDANINKYSFYINEIESKITPITNEVDKQTNILSNEINSIITYLLSNPEIQKKISNNELSDEEKMGLTKSININIPHIKSLYIYKNIEILKTNSNDTTYEHQIIKNQDALLMMPKDPTSDIVNSAIKLLNSINTDQETNQNQEIKNFEKEIKSIKEQHINPIGEKYNTLKTSLEKKIEIWRIHYANEIEALAIALQTKEPQKSPYINNLIGNLQKQNTPVSSSTFINIPEQVSTPKLSYSGLNIPSQSEMIEAMAIFLAKRTKQEAAIWFMDQLRERIKNPLVYETFPETIKLLESLEDYKSANFGKSWRHAISSDFVKMPKNIVNSTYAKIHITDTIELKNIKTAVDFGYELNKLIYERYNYRDIIRQLYLNQDYKDEKPQSNNNNSKDLKTSLRKSFLLFYIITNELFTINNNTYRLLTFEEIKNISSDQWIIWQELCKMRYGNDWELNKIGDNFKKEKINEIASLLISFNQLDNLNEEFQQLRTNNILDINSQTFNSIWKTFKQILKTYNSLDKNFEYIEKSLDIILAIQQKEFMQAAQNCLYLVDKFSNVQKQLSLQIDKNSVKIDEIHIPEIREILDKTGIQKIIFKNDSENLKTTIKTSESDKIELLFKKDSLIEIRKLRSYKNLDITNISHKIENIILNSITDSNKRDSLKSLLNTNNLKKFINILDLYYTLSSLKGNANQIKKSIEDLKLNKIDFSNDQLPKNLLTILSNKKYTGEYTETFLKLTNFFTDVMASADSEQLANVIESYALPPTSYKIKRKMKYSLDLNAYVGVFGGAYRFRDSTNTNRHKGTGGITAPIGITSTLNGCFSLNLQIIDLGNIVNHYLVTPTDAYNKEVHFTEVLSPGVNIMGNIPSTPLVYFLGYSGVPLRSYTREENNKKTTYNNKLIDGHYFKLGIKMDIPLLNLHSKER